MCVQVCVGLFRDDTPLWKCKTGLKLGIVSVGHRSFAPIIGGGSGGDVSPPLNFRWGDNPPLNFIFFFFVVVACHPGGRCCVPRVPLPNNVNDVRKLSGKKMGGSSPPPPPPAHQLFWELRERLYTFSGLEKPRPSPPPPPNTLNFGLPPPMAPIYPLQYFAEDSVHGISWKWCCSRVYTRFEAGEATTK